MCIHDGCDTIPCYNFQGQKKAIYCKKHKQQEMVDVVNKRCLHEGCDKQPTYNFQGQKKALYCNEHKREEMVDVVNKRCLHEGCHKLPTYNFQGQKQRLYCNEHKQPEMVDIVHKRCLHEGCDKQPTYNFQGQKKALYCNEHKREEMVDVVNKRCLHEGCHKQPTYNFQGQKKALYCNEHKQQEMVDIVHKRCLTHLCDTHVTNKYKGYCFRCFMYIFPESPLLRNYKTKEASVVAFVKGNFETYSWISDKRVEGGCSRRRPDLLLDLGQKVIIIEIDENQHVGYDCSCENKRIMEISQDLGHCPIIFIRFNPDDYLQGNANVTSCWGITKAGICQVKPSKMNEWNTRLSSLQSVIEYWIHHDSERTVEIIQLYYDVDCDDKK